MSTPGTGPGLAKSLTARDLNSSRAVAMALSAPVRMVMKQPAFHAQWMSTGGSPGVSALA